MWIYTFEKGTLSAKQGRGMATDGVDSNRRVEKRQAYYSEGATNNKKLELTNDEESMNPTPEVLKRTMSYKN